MTPDDAFDEPVDFPAEITAQLDELFAKRIATAAAITKTLARDAGYGDFESLEPRTRQVLEEAVEEACNDWRGAAAAAANRPMAPHQRLLLQYHDLGETILGIQDAALRRALAPRAAADHAVWRLSKA
jgi:hypothetical protein